MYLLSIPLGITAYVVSRGPDGRLHLFFVGFAIMALTYVTLAWITRHQAIWGHLPVHLLLYLGIMALGMAPKPRLDEMAGMMYLFAPLAIVATVILACLVRLIARWT
jgi:hypothetical protein